MTKQIEFAALTQVVMHEKFRFERNFVNVTIEVEKLIMHFAELASKLRFIIILRIAIVQVNHNGEFSFANFAFIKPISCVVIIRT